MPKKQEVIENKKSTQTLKSAGVLKKKTPEKVEQSTQTVTLGDTQKVEKSQRATVPAVIVLGSKQFVVKGGEELIVEKLDHKDGATFVVDDILHGKKVTCSVIGPVAGPKIDILKFKNKTRYLRHMGHRQKYTKISITSLS